ncbi:DUF4041 domain-containing protein [Cellulosimicrobium aquatile]|uniref:DUF4041 domain-containing protein n=1 Tax=Cellulosimicrobium aquatile TaxID=1612203 RepID=UPI001FCD8449|nr:DUF4041 domain-containing protein [Cellulosimicrobium aquatile]
MPSSTATERTGGDPGIPLFGARRRARELAASADGLRAENERLLAELHRVGALDAVTIEREREDARRRYQDEAIALEVERQASREKFTAEIAELTARRDALGARVREFDAKVVHLEETEILQEVGVYEYQHPLADVEAYKARLTTLRGHIMEMAKADGGAILAASGWTVNGSVAQGRKMVSQTSKLMLRAYNAEADALVRALKPHRLAASIDRLEKTATTIERLGTTMSIRVSSAYQRARIDELRLTADYLAKVEEEKETNRAAREALREQRKVEQEMARAREKLEKEKSHLANVLETLRAKGDLEAVARYEAQLADVDRAIEDVDYRAANQRAGYVYVISNLGAFGEGMIKIGMTRRLEPMDRVRELGDASVPFGFDVHALFFSDDAVGIEAEMHRRLAEKRVNRVNLRREFFYATPHDALVQLRDLAGDVLQFTELPEALEYRQSQNLRTTG